jgi:hypothetical protein
MQRYLGSVCRYGEFFTERQQHQFISEHLHRIYTFIAHGIIAIGR